MSVQLYTAGDADPELQGAVLVLVRLVVLYWPRNAPGSSSVASMRGCFFVLTHLLLDRRCRGQQAPCLLVLYA